MTEWANHYFARLWKIHNKSAGRQICFKVFESSPYRGQVSCLLLHWICKVKGLSPLAVCRGRICGKPDAKVGGLASLHVTVAGPSVVELSRATEIQGALCYEYESQCPKKASRASLWFVWVPCWRCKSTESVRLSCKFLTVYGTNSEALGMVSCLYRLYNTFVPFLGCVEWLKHFCLVSVFGLLAYSCIFIWWGFNVCDCNVSVYMESFPPSCQWS